MPSSDKLPLKYKVRQGDCISSIAFKYGLFPDTIWNHAENAALKELRKNRNILYPGDEVHIPAKRMKEVPGVTETRHKFKRKGVPEKLIMTLVAENDEPLSSKPYTLDIDGTLHKGTTGVDGKLEVDIRPDAQKARLFLEGEAEPYELGLGKIDPIDTTSGGQRRLNNLGYGCPVEAILDDETKEALMRFQHDNELEVTACFDDPTQKKLEELHLS